MSEAPKLKPCPFCGGPAELRVGDEHAYIQCLCCSGHNACFTAGDNDAASEAVFFWNTRPVYDAQAKMAEAAETALKQLDYWFDTDDDILAAMTPDVRADHERQHAKVRQALAALQESSHD